MISLHAIRVGDTISYKLRPIDMPNDPDRLWTGRVLIVIVDNPCLLDHVKVQILDDGFTGDSELVYPEQIVHHRPTHERTGVENIV